MKRKIKCITQKTQEHSSIFFFFNLAFTRAYSWCGLLVELHVAERWPLASKG